MKPDLTYTVIVCGSRTFDDAAAVGKALDVVLDAVIGSPVLTRDSLIIVEGGAKGADALARLWANAHRVRNITVPADWDQHGKAAGPIRNQKMLDEHKPQLVIGFKDKPESRGTDDMLRRAARANVPTLAITPWGAQQG